MFQQILAGAVERAELIDFFYAQTAIGFSLAVKLQLVCFLDTLADGAAFLSSDLLFHQFLLRHGRYFDLHVDAVEQRAGDSSAVAGDLVGSAVASAGGVAQISTHA